MITVISGTNRADSRSSIVAKLYFDKLSQQLPSSELQFVDLKDLPSDFVHAAMYGNPSDSFKKFQEEHLFPSDKFIFVVPEYNGAFPGIFKLMIDASDITKAFYNKKAALVGVSAGRAGNLRGLDNLTNMLNYIKMDILKNKLPISGISQLINAENELNHQATLDTIDAQITEFLEY